MSEDTGVIELAVNKVELRIDILDFLYSSSIAAHNKLLNNILDRNKTLMNTESNSILFNGTTYSLSNHENTRGMKPTRLHSDLQEEMLKLIKEINYINEYEYPYIQGFITSVLNESDSIVDYKRIFPEEFDIPIDTYAVFNGIKDSTLTDEEVEKIKIKNKNALNVLKQKKARELIVQY